MDHYLTIQKWKSNFFADGASVSSTAVWIHISGLPIEYFDEGHKVDQCPTRQLENIQKEGTQETQTTTEKISSNENQGGNRFEALREEKINEDKDVDDNCKDQHMREEGKTQVNSPLEKDHTQVTQPTSSTGMKTLRNKKTVITQKQGRQDNISKAKFFKEEGSNADCLDRIIKFRVHRDRCNLIDSGWTANKFTWVTVLPRHYSDHHPIMIDTDLAVNIDKERRPFLFEDFWLTHPDFKEIFSTAWNNKETLVRHVIDFFSSLFEHREVGIFTGFAPTGKDSLFSSHLVATNNQSQISPQPVNQSVTAVVHSSNVNPSLRAKIPFPEKSNELDSSKQVDNDVVHEVKLLSRRLLIVFTPSSTKDRFQDHEAELNHQRNVALKHIEHHKLSGIVHFAGLSNVYDLHFFQELRQIQLFETWPMVVLSANKRNVVMEGPLCDSSQVIGWHLRKKNNQTDADTESETKPLIDISSFAFNSSILWDPERWGRPTSGKGTSQTSKYSLNKALHIENKEYPLLYTL
ncbi:putative beta-1,4-xylosyltransferase IRX9 [Hibiscus syriacus]|uniref:Glycosyltransferases n=1 Tax=Hibiscus syriacus TaxID=106335 RepID=A0A6A3BW32_HIBSY|nr:putative beta-1,4-xylosyltransferase IRX9 [Hibiscus syriacus]